MYRHSPVRNQRSKGIKTKHVVQVCLLLAVCFWLIFQLKRSHHSNKHFDHPNISRADQILKFGRKDLQPKLQDTTTAIQMHQDTSQEQQDEDEDGDEENKHEEEEQDEDKTDDGGGGGDDEIDENEQDKSNMQIDRDEVDIIDEDRDTEESEEDKVTEEKDGETQTENTAADHDEDGSTEHTHEAREEHYKADDASSAVITHDPGNEIKNATLDDHSSENGGNENLTLIQEKDSESTPSVDFHENGPPPNTTTTSSNATVQGFSKNSSDESISENLERSIEDPTHLEEKELRNDLESLRNDLESLRNDLELLPDVETEGGNSEDTAAE